MVIGGADHSCDRMDHMWHRPPSWTWAQVDGAAGNQSVAQARSDLFAGEGEFVDYGYAARGT